MWHGTRSPVRLDEAPTGRLRRLHHHEARQATPGSGYPSGQRRRVRRLRQHRVAGLRGAHSRQRRREAPDAAYPPMPQPTRRANAATSRRDPVSVLRSRFETCTLTVFSLMKSACCDLGVGPVRDQMGQHLGLPCGESGKGGGHNIGRREAWRSQRDAGCLGQFLGHGPQRNRALGTDGIEQRGSFVRATGQRRCQGGRSHDIECDPREPRLSPPLPS